MRKLITEVVEMNLEVKWGLATRKRREGTFQTLSRVCTKHGGQTAGTEVRMCGWR